MMIRGFAIIGLVLCFLVDLTSYGQGSIRDIMNRDTFKGVIFNLIRVMNDFMPKVLY